MKAWATLLTQPGYVVGVRALRASLERVGTAYPLVVVVTDGIDAPTRALLESEGCVVREVAPVRPPSGLKDSYANARFAEVWTKLGVWSLTEWDRLVVLDADMLAVRDMDELFTLDLPDDTVAACHACRCNPNRIASYPASWTPQGCAYTYLAAGQPLPSDGLEPYFNGGTLVLHPDADVHAALLAELAGVEDLTRYPFAEQDFLNEHFRGRWHVLPYVYNALKTLPFQHPGLWHAEDVRNLHYIIDKPWDVELTPGDRYHDLHALWWQVGADLVPAGSEVRVGV